MKPRLKIIKFGWEYRWVCFQDDSVVVVGSVHFITLNDICSAAEAK